MDKLPVAAILFISIPEEIMLSALGLFLFGIRPKVRFLILIGVLYNVPIKLDKISDNLSEPDIIKDRKLSGRKVHITWPKGDNLQQNSKLELYWNSLRKKNSLAS